MADEVAAGGRHAGILRVRGHPTCRVVRADGMPDVEYADARCAPDARRMRAGCAPLAATPIVDPGAPSARLPTVGGAYVASAVVIAPTCARALRPPLLDPREMSPSRPPGYRDSLIRISLLVALAVAVLFPAGLWLERALADRLIESRIDDMQRSFAREAARAMRRITLAEARVARLASGLALAAREVDASDAPRFDRATRRAPNGTVRWATRSEPAARDALDSRQRYARPVLEGDAPAHHGHPLQRRCRRNRRVRPTISGSCRSRAWS